MNKAAKRLREVANAERAEFVQRYFKTGPGQYGEGDRFLGVTVPLLRTIAREFKDLPEKDLAKLLESPWHEERSLALLIMVRRARAEPDEMYRLYFKHIDRVNNWDLVDVSAPAIVGPLAAPKVLTSLAKSPSVWKRRIAIIATQHLIRRGEFAETLRIAEILLNDHHDLIHKAVGWMLRQVGDRDRKAEEAFLDAHAARMPRTMLRYAIEKFDARTRKRYLLWSAAAKPPLS